MVFNSLDFLVFFPIVVLVYGIVPKKVRYLWLLIASYYFYMSWNPKYAFLILTSTIITYGCSLLCDRLQKTWQRKSAVVFSLVSNLGILFVFKYFNFFMDTFGKVLSHAGISVIERRLDLLLPVGISFYTFQALSYTLDVYRGQVKAEKNFLRYALFVSFFPQLVAGPIERSKNLLSQINNIEKIKIWNYDNIREGFWLMMWGLFQKMVIADRAGLLVDTVYNSYTEYGALEIIVATMLFAAQIYCDFGGYSNMAIGAAKVMGFDLMQNFRQPYLATSIKDFWRRWHISLTSWFTDYIYIPLGGNRKGTLCKYVNIMIVFGISGLWHGASFSFIAWGLLHGIYQVAGDAKYKLQQKCEPFRQKCIAFFEVPDRSGSISCKLRRMFFTFVLVDFAWIFFAANSFREAFGIIRQIFTTVYTVGLFEIGLSAGNWWIMVASLLILLFVDICHEKGIALQKAFVAQELWLRWACYLVLLWTIVMFGIYGTAYDASTFIYFQF